MKIVLFALIILSFNASHAQELSARLKGSILLKHEEAQALLASDNCPGRAILLGQVYVLASLVSGAAQTYAWEAVQKDRNSINTNPKVKQAMDLELLAERIMNRSIFSKTQGNICDASDSDHSKVTTLFAETVAGIGQLYSAVRQF